MANIFYSDSDVMKPADHKNAVCSLLDERVMSFSNARMITHVQTSIVIITLRFHTRALNKSFVVVVYFFICNRLFFIEVDIFFDINREIFLFKRLLLYITINPK